MFSLPQHAAGDGAAAPEIHAVMPGLAATTGGETLTIMGQRFAPGVSVSIAGAPSARVNWRSPEEIQAEVPMRLGMQGKVLLEVKNPDGAGASSGDLFGYYPGLFGFHKKVDHDSGVAQVGLRLVDLNRDGKLDLLAAFEARGLRRLGSTLSVFYGRGDGSFELGHEHGADAGLFSMAVEDLDRDGATDVAMVNALTGAVVLYKGDPEGRLSWKANLPAGAYPVSVAIADLDRNGIGDLITCNFGDRSLTLLLGDKDGTFRAQTMKLGFTPWAVAAADINGDGVEDLAVTVYRYNEVAIFLGRGDGTLHQKGEYQTGAAPYAAAFAHLDGDRKIDLLVANKESNTVTVLLGKGDGTFSFKGAPYVGNTPYSLTVGDVNGDGRQDLLLPCFDLKQVSVLLGKGDGSFQQAVMYPVGGFVTSLAAGDLNNDGRVDVVSANTNATYSVLLNSSQ